MFKRVIFAAIFCSVVICGVAAGEQSAKAEHEEHYFAVLIDGKKIGHSLMAMTVADGKVTHEMQMSMSMNRMGTVIPVEVTSRTVETVEGEPVGFETEMNASGFGNKAVGRMNEDGAWDVEVTTMGTTQKKVVPMPEGAMMEHALSLYLEGMEIEEGDTISVKYFDPTMLDAVKMDITLGGLEEVDLFGRVVEARKVRSVMHAPTGSIVSESHVAGEDLSVPVKTVTAMMGMKLEIIACTKEFALSDNDVLDFMDRLLLRSPVALEGLAEKTEATYVVEPLGKEDFMLPAGPGQSVMKKANGELVVEVTRREPVGGEFPYEGDDEKLLEALESSAYLQAEDEKVVELARGAVDGCETAGQAVKKIEQFVHGYISAKDLSVGYASAAEVARSRQGDCTEHAVLTAAMCRAVGIPARVVTGVVYVDNFVGRDRVFGGHAWSEAWVNGKWVGLDATRGEMGCDVGRITLARGDGEPGNFMGVATTLGYFKIVGVELE